MVKGAVQLAVDIAAKSPIAVQGSKTNLVYSRDHTVAEGLDYVVINHKIASHFINIHTG